MGQVVQLDYKKQIRRSSIYGRVTLIRERLISIEYHGGAADRISRCRTIEGAIKAAVLRIAHGQYTACDVYDDRFGTNNRHRHALSIRMFRNGIAIEWKAQPKWEYPQ